jgi:hypothetical protein
MSETLSCFRCGQSLAALTPPISRQDACPSCSSFLHVCRMCINFDSNVVAQCREDEAEEVFDKENTNFCDWFEPSPDAFDATGKRQDDDAKSAAEALFDGAAADSGDDDQASAAEDLFR